MEDDSQCLVFGIFVGILTTSLFMFMLWVTGMGYQVNKTTDGRYYIKTHLKYYEVVSKKPIQIGNIIIKEEKEGK